MRLYQSIFLLILTLALGFSPLLASAANEVELKEIRRTYEENNKRVAEALLLLDQLRQEFLSLKGSVGENQHYLGEHQQKSDKLFQEIDSRLTLLEEQMATMSKQMREILTEVSGEGSPEKRLYYEILATMNRQQYKEVLNITSVFLQKYSAHAYAPKVQYWRGEAYLAMKDYKAAIPEFQKVMKAFPKSDQVPSALLRQGICFYELRVYEDAKLFLQKLVIDYAESDEAKTARHLLERIEQRLSPSSVPATSAPALPAPPSSAPSSPSSPPEKQPVESSDLSL